MTRTAPTATLRTSYGLCSAHFWIFILLPFTLERVQKTTFLVVHETTVVKLLLGYGVLQLLLSVVFAPSWLLLRIRTFGTRPGWVRFVVYFPAGTYFVLIMSKWLLNLEWAPLLATSLVLLAMRVSHRLVSPVGSFVRDLVPIALGVAVLASGGLAATTVPLFRPPSQSSFVEDASVQVPNVVWIVLDELGANALLDADGDIDTDSYPSLARLKDQSTWYSNTVTPHTWTIKAVPSILTGDQNSTGANLPMDWLKDLPSGVEQFGYSDIGLKVCMQATCQSADYLNADGFGVLIKDLAVVIGHKFLPSPISAQLPALGTSWARIGERRHRSQAASWWLDELRRTSATASPFVTVAHSLMSHHPWTYDHFGGSFINPGQNYSRHHFFPATCDDEINFKNYLCTDDITRLNKRIYGANIRAVDQMIDEAVTILEEADKFDSTMIIITADHGFAFANNKDGRRIAPDDVYWQDLVKVPLLVKYPDQQQGSVVNERRDTTQILHSVLDVLGLEPGKPISPPLSEMSDLRTVDGNPQNLDFIEPSRWIADGGSYVQRENKTYPYALGRAAEFVGQRVDSIVTPISPIPDATIVVDRHRDAPSPADQQYRHLVGGFFDAGVCIDGSLVLIDTDVIVGTAHTYPSFQQPNKTGYWGIVQAPEPIADPQIHCLV